jgi:hypothetical protein
MAALSGLRDAADYAVADRPGPDDLRQLDCRGARDRLVVRSAEAPPRWLRDRTMTDTRADWKAILSRTEPLGPRLLVRVRLLQHRHHRDRVRLTTECLRWADAADELSAVGGTERTLDGADGQRCRAAFARAIHSIVTSRER